MVMDPPVHLVVVYVVVQIFWPCNGYPLDVQLSAGGAGAGPGGAGPGPGAAPLLLACGSLVCSVLLVAGCLCCRRSSKGFQEFTDSASTHSLPGACEGSQGPGAGAGAEVTLFPPPAVVSTAPAASAAQGPRPGADRASVVRFDPLPDLHSPGAAPAAPSAASSCRPAAFSSAVSHGLNAHDWFENPHFNFPRSHLKYVKEMGNGWFGRAVEGEALGIIPGQDTTRVVVKILHEDATATDHMFFLHEVVPYRDLRHPNVLRLLGRCLESDPFLIVLEACSSGDLKSFLSQNMSTADALSQQGVTLSMCRQVADGLLFMHQHGFVHTDLAARNCLVTSDLTVKIGDYGISIDTFKEDYYCTSDVALPIRWCAPETLHCTDTTIETKEVTPCANVWSLGVVFWEICEFGKLPYEELSDEEVIVKVLVESCVCLGFPTRSSPHQHNLYRLMKSCWSPASERPPLSQVVAMLNHLYENCKTNSQDHSDCLQSDIDFDQRWESFKPNTIPITDNHVAVNSRVQSPLGVDVSDVLPSVLNSSSLSLTMNGSKNDMNGTNSTPNHKTSMSESFFQVPSASPLVSPQPSLTSSSGGETFVPSLHQRHKSPSLQNLSGSLEDLTDCISNLPEEDTAEKQTIERDSGMSNDIENAGISDSSRENLSSDFIDRGAHEPDFDSWLHGVETTNEEDAKFVRKISEAIRDLDNALALEKTSSSSSALSSKNESPEQSRAEHVDLKTSDSNVVLDFRLGFTEMQSDTFLFKDLSSGQPDSLLDESLLDKSLPSDTNNKAADSGTDTEDEIWRKKIEHGEFTAKVKEKSKSVADLMILTHIDCSDGSDSEPPSLTWSYDRGSNGRNSFTKAVKVNNFASNPLSFASESNIHQAVLGEDFRDTLLKLHEAQKDQKTSKPSSESEDPDPDPDPDPKSASVETLRAEPVLQESTKGNSQNNCETELSPIKKNNSFLVDDASENNMEEPLGANRKTSMGTDECITLSGNTTSEVPCQESDLKVDGEAKTEMLFAPENLNVTTEETLSSAFLQKNELGATSCELFPSSPASVSQIHFVVQNGMAVNNSHPILTNISCEDLFQNEGKSESLCDNSPKTETLCNFNSYKMPVESVLTNDNISAQNVPCVLSNSDISCELTSYNNLCYNLSSVSNFENTNNNCKLPLEKDLKDVLCTEDKTTKVNNKNLMNKCNDKNVHSSVEIESLRNLERNIHEEERNNHNTIVDEFQVHNNSDKIMSSVADSFIVLSGDQKNIQERERSEIWNDLPSDVSYAQLGESDSKIPAVDALKSAPVENSELHDDSDFHSSHNSHNTLTPKSAQILTEPTSLVLDNALNSLKELSNEKVLSSNNSLDEKQEVKEKHLGDMSSLSCSIGTEPEEATDTISFDLSSVINSTLISPTDIEVQAGSLKKLNNTECNSCVTSSNIENASHSACNDSARIVDKCVIDENSSCVSLVSEKTTPEENIHSNIKNSCDLVEEYSISVTNQVMPHKMTKDTSESVISFDSRLNLKDSSGGLEIETSESSDKELPSVCLKEGTTHCDNIVQKSQLDAEETPIISGENKRLNMVSDVANEIFTKNFSENCNTEEIYNGGKSVSLKEISDVTSKNTILNNNLENNLDKRGSEPSDNIENSFVTKTKLEEWKHNNSDILNEEFLHSQNHSSLICESSYIHMDTQEDLPEFQSEKSENDGILESEEGEEYGIDAVKHSTPDDERSSDSGFRDKGSLSESCEDACDEKYHLEDIEAELEETFSKSKFCYVVKGLSRDEDHTSSEDLPQELFPDQDVASTASGRDMSPCEMSSSVSQTVVETKRDNVNEENDHSSLDGGLTSLPGEAQEVLQGDENPHYMSVSPARTPDLLNIETNDTPMPDVTSPHSFKVYFSSSQNDCDELLQGNNPHCISDTYSSNGQLNFFQEKDMILDIGQTEFRTDSPDQSSPGDASCESSPVKRGWFLHSQNDGPGHEVNCTEQKLYNDYISSAGPNSFLLVDDNDNNRNDDYCIPLSLNEEFVTAIRNELQEKLPCARKQNEDSEDDGILEPEDEPLQGERTNITIHYSAYPPPLSPILEERESVSSITTTLSDNIFTKGEQLHESDSEPASPVFVLDTIDLKAETDSKVFEEEIREALENCSISSVETDSFSEKDEKNKCVIVEDLEKPENATSELAVKNQVEETLTVFKSTSPQVDFDDDFLVIDVETNHATLLESPKPKSHLAFVKNQLPSQVDSNLEISQLSRVFEESSPSLSDEAEKCLPDTKPVGMCSEAAFSSNLVSLSCHMEVPSNAVAGEQSGNNTESGSSSTDKSLFTIDSIDSLNSQQILEHSSHNDCSENCCHFMTEPASVVEKISIGAPNNEAAEILYELENSDILHNLHQDSSEENSSNVPIYMQNCTNLANHSVKLVSNENDSEDVSEDAEGDVSGSSSGETNIEKDSEVFSSEPSNDSSNSESNFNLCISSTNEPFTKIPDVNVNECNLQEEGCEQSSTDGLGLFKNHKAHQQETVMDDKDWSKPILEATALSTKAPMPSPEDELWKQIPSMLAFSDLNDMMSRCRNEGEFSENYDAVGSPGFQSHDNEEDLMTTSFSLKDSDDIGDCYTPDWESEEDTNEEDNSSSSGEFIWKPFEAHSEFAMEMIAEEDEDEEEDEEDDDGSLSSNSGSDFVPSTWDSGATPSRSALRTPEKAELQMQKKSVSFKKQKYHCVYEYPREPSDSEGELTDSPSQRRQWNIFNFDVDYASYADWELAEGDVAAAPEAEVDKDPDSAHDSAPDPATDPATDSATGPRAQPSHTFDIYKLSSVDYDLSTDSLPGDGEFYISSSARPFQFTAATNDLFDGNGSEFFPGQLFEDVTYSTLAEVSDINLDFAPFESVMEDKKCKNDFEADDPPVQELVDASNEPDTINGHFKSPNSLVDCSFSMNSGLIDEKVDQMVVVAPREDSPSLSQDLPSSPMSPTSGLGELRHTRDKLKLDLPVSCSTFLLDMPVEVKRRSVETIRGEASLLDSEDEIENC